MYISTNSSELLFPAVCISEINKGEPKPSIPASPIQTEGKKYSLIVGHVPIYPPSTCTAPVSIIKSNPFMVVVEISSALNAKNIRILESKLQAILLKVARQELSEKLQEGLKVPARVSLEASKLPSPVSSQRDTPELVAPPLKGAKSVIGLKPVLLATSFKVIAKLVKVPPMESLR